MFLCHLFRQIQSVEVGMEGFFLKYLALRPDTRNWSRMSPFLSVPLILTYLLSHSCDITHLWKSRGSFVRTLFVLYRNFRISSNEKGRFKNNSRIRYLQFELKNFRGKSNVAIPLGSKTLFTSFAQSLGSFKCSRSWELLILLKQSSLKGKNCASATMVIFSDLYMSTLMSPFGASPEPISSDRSFLSKLPRPQVCQQMAGSKTLVSSDGLRRLWIPHPDSESTSVWGKSYAPKPDPDRRSDSRFTSWSILSESEIQKCDQCC